jgi:hypothetical protein
VLKPIKCSAHAVQRMAQRNLTYSEIEYVCHHGRRVHRAGVVHYYLGWRDIPAPDRRDARIQKLEGTTVLIGGDHSDEVVTVYRNKNGTKNLRCKAKFNRNTTVNIQY